VSDRCSRRLHRLNIGCDRRITRASTGKLPGGIGGAAGRTAATYRGNWSDCLGIKHAVTSAIKNGYFVVSLISPISFSSPSLTVTVNSDFAGSE